MENSHGMTKPMVIFFLTYIFFSTKKYKLVNVNQPNSKSTEIEPGL